MINPDSETLKKMSSPPPIAIFSSLSLEDDNEDFLPIPLSVPECSHSVNCAGTSSLPPNYLTTHDSRVSCLVQNDFSQTTKDVPGLASVLATEDAQAGFSTAVLSEASKSGKMSDELPPQTLHKSSSTSELKMSADYFSQSDADSSVGLAQEDLPVTVPSSSTMFDPKFEKLAASDPLVTSAEPGMEVLQDKLHTLEPSPESPVECGIVGDSTVVQLQPPEASPDQQCGVSLKSEPWVELAAEKSVNTLQLSDSVLSTQEVAQDNCNTFKQSPDQIQSPQISCSQEQSVVVSTSTPWLPESVSSVRQTGQSNVNIPNMSSGQTQRALNSCCQELSEEEADFTPQCPELSSSTHKSAESDLNASDQSSDLIQWLPNPCHKEILAADSSCSLQLPDSSSSMQEATQSDLNTSCILPDPVESLSSSCPQALSMEVSTTISSLTFDQAFVLRQTHARPHSQEVSIEVPDSCLQTLELSSSTTQETMEMNLIASTIPSVPILTSEESASTLEQPKSQETANSNLDVSGQSLGRTHSALSGSSQEILDAVRESVSTLQLQATSYLSSPTESFTERHLNACDQPIRLRPVSELEAELELRLAEKSIMSDNGIEGENDSDTHPGLSVVDDVSEQNSESVVEQTNTQTGSYMDSASQVDCPESLHQPQIFAASTCTQPPTHVEFPSTSYMEHTVLHYGTPYSQYHSAHPQYNASVQLLSASGASLHPQLGNVLTKQAIQHGTCYYQLAPAIYLASHPQYTSSIVSQQPQLPMNCGAQELLVHANYSLPQPQASVSCLPPRQPNLDTASAVQGQSSLGIDTETGPSQGFSMSLYEKYKLWQQYRPRACMYVSDSRDSDALACFFVPVLRSPCLINSHIPLEKAEAIAVTEWNMLSNFDRMEYYNMAQQFLEFEQWELNFKAKGMEAERHPMGYSWKRRPQAGRGKRTARHKSNPKSSGNTLSERAQMQELMEGALKEYIDVMEALEARSEVKEGSEVMEECAEQEDKEENESFTEYLNELCSQKEFVTQVGEVIDLDYVSSLVSSDPDSSDNLTESLIQKEKETSETPHMSAPVVPESTGGHADASYASISGTQPGTSVSQDGQPSFCLQSQHLQANHCLGSLDTTMSGQGIVPESYFVPPYAYYYQTPNISSHSFMERGAPVVPPSELPFPQIYGMEKYIPQPQSNSSHHEFQTAQHHYHHPVPCIPVVNSNKTCNSMNEGFYAISDNCSAQVPVVNHENHGSKTYIFATANQNSSQETKHVYIPAQDCDSQPPSASQQQTKCPPFPIPMVQNDRYTTAEQYFLSDEPIALTDACNILDAANPSSISSSSQNIIASEHDNVHLMQGINQKDADKHINSSEKQGYIYTVLLNSGSQREPSPPSLDSLISMAPDQEQGSYESQSSNLVEGPSNLQTSESTQPESRGTETVSPMSVLPVEGDVMETLSKIPETGHRILECLYNEDTNDSIRVQAGDVQDPEDIEDRFEQCNTPPQTPSLSPYPLHSLPSQDNDSQLFLQSQQQVNQMTERPSSCPFSLAFLCLQALASMRDQSLALNEEPTEPFVSLSTALQHPPSPIGHSDQPCSTNTDLHGLVTMNGEPTLTCFVAVASSSSPDLGWDSHLRGWVIDTNITDSMTREKRSEVSNKKKHLSKSEDVKSSGHVRLDYETVDDVVADKTIDCCSVEIADRKEEHIEKDMCPETDEPQNNPYLDHNARTSVHDPTVISNLEIKVNETQEIQVEKQALQSLMHKATYQDTDLSTHSGGCSPLLVTARRSSRGRKPTAKQLQSYNQGRKIEIKRQQLDENTDKVRGKHMMTEVDTAMIVNQGSHDRRTGPKEAQQEMQRKENEDKVATGKHTDTNTYLSGRRAFDEGHISNVNECEGIRSVEKDSSEMQSHLTEKDTSIYCLRLTRSRKKLMNTDQVSADSERKVSQTVKGKMTGKSYNQGRKIEIKRQQLDENTDKLRGKHMMTEVDTAMIVNQGSHDRRTGAKEAQQKMQRKENEDKEATEKHTDTNTCLSGRRAFDEEHIDNVNESEGKRSVEKDSSEMQSHLTEKDTSIYCLRLTRSRKKLMNTDQVSADNERKVSQTVKGKMIGKPVGERTGDNTVTGSSNGPRFRKGRLTENQEKYPDTDGKDKSTMEDESTGGQLGEAGSPQPKQEKNLKGETRKRIGQDTYDIDPPSTAVINDVTEAHSPESLTVKLARHADEKNSTDSKMTANSVNPETTITEMDRARKSWTPTVTKSRRLTRSSAVAKEIIDRNMAQNTREKAVNRTQDDDKIDLPFTVVIHDKIARDDRFKKEETETVQEVIIMETGQGKQRDTDAVKSKSRRLTRGAVARKEIQMEKYVKTESSKDYKAQTSVKGGSLQPSSGENGNAETEEVTAIAVTREVIMTEADKMSQTITGVVNETHSGRRRSRRLTKGFVSGKVVPMEMGKEKLSTAVEKRPTMKNDTAPRSLGKASNVSGEDIEIQQKMAQSEKKQSEVAEREGDTKDADAECSLKDAGGETICLKPQEGEVEANCEDTVEDVEKDIGLYPLLVQEMSKDKEKLESIVENLQTNAKASPPMEIQNVDRPKSTRYLNDIEAVRETAEDLTRRIGSNMKTHSMRTRSQRADRSFTEESESVVKTEERPNTSQIDQVAKTNEREMNVKTNTEKQSSRTSRDQTQEGETDNTTNSNKQTAKINKQNTKERLKGKTINQDTERGFEVNTFTLRTRSGKVTRSEPVECKKKQNTEEWTSIDRTKSKKVETQIQTRSRRPARSSGEDREIQRTEKVMKRRVVRREAPQNGEGRSKSEHRAMDVKPTTERQSSTSTTGGKLQQAVMEEEQTILKDIMVMRAEENIRAQSSREMMKEEKNGMRRVTRERMRTTKTEGTNKLPQEKETKGHAKEGDTHAQRANQDDRKKQTENEATERCQKLKASLQRRLRERWSARIKKREKRRCKKY